MIITVFITLSFGGCTESNPGFNPGEPCAPGATGPTNCSGGTTCDTQSGICVCPDTKSLCGTQCVDTLTANANCGGCGLACPSRETCSLGRCSGGGCAGGAMECEKQCVDPKTNPRHCGGCRDASGKRCGDGEACVAGVCTPEPCPFGATLCGSACVELGSSAQHCGKCSRPCPDGTFCGGGQCVSECLPGLTRCGGSCTNTRRDPNNCGKCGEVCKLGELCARDGSKSKCQEYKFAPCKTCPCSSCGDNNCCKVPDPRGGYRVLCVEDGCPRL